MGPKLENSAVAALIRRIIFPVMVCCLLLSGCRSGPTDATSTIEFSKVPLVDAGGAGKIAAIEGRVTGARPGQQVVLFARSGAWYVQPFTDQPFTKIQPDATWRNSTHLGTEYAALLVEPGYRPPAVADVLPDKGGGVIAVAVVQGEVRLMVPLFWQAWWFRLLGVLACIVALVAFHHLRLHRLAHQLNARFNERLEERTRIAQDLHDTLLQGFISASMQLHVAVEQFPQNTPERSHLDRVQQLMGRVIEEGRNTLHGLRSITKDSLDLQQAFSRIPQELANQDGIEQQVRFRVTTRGRPRPIHPLIRDEIYCISREAIINAFRRSRTKSVEAELKYSIRRLRIFVRDDGGAIGSQAMSAEPLELARLRERAGRIGARLKVRNPATAGTEVELSVPGRIAFPNEYSIPPLRWLARLSSRIGKPEAGESE